MPAVAVATTHPDHGQATTRIVQARPKPNVELNLYLYLTCRQKQHLSRSKAESNLNLTCISNTSFAQELRALPVQSSPEGSAGARVAPFTPKR